ncbi:dialkylrecorsinol condensing enzyme [Paucimonas lemoignei]|uniref:dialkylrecorsinol condensing enzyme n=1 Tax=Paucimonas lemoignei TaxID=29443 RepID=UPI001FB499E3|nr:dialkylrecorsinol condensing enzyme [Paucimonas lemoignei]
MAPLQENGEFEITFLPIEPIKPYPFPWSFFRFLDAFPESIGQIAPQIKPLALKDSDQFDLILLPYQIWFLAPSLPVQALLQDPSFKRVAQGKPVVTLIACRNMWHLAQEKVKASLKTIGARLLDNVVLTDQGGTFATFITVPRWLLTGKSDAFMGLPAAGVHPDEIRRARRFGLALRDALLQDKEKGDQSLLYGLGAVKADPTLLVSERAGTRSFTVWGKLVRAVGKPGAFARMPVLVLYVTFLLAIIATVVPASLTLQFLLRPFLRNKLAAAKQYFEAPSGSGSERLAQYE